MRLGWEVLDLSEESRRVINLAINELKARLFYTWNVDCDLENYRNDSEEEHERIQSDLAEFFIRERYGWQIIAASLGQFQRLIGMDLHIQKYPYMRVARPGKVQDNIGIHRDTKYGGTPYEVSCVIPLTTMGPEGQLHVLDGSHIEPEGAYPHEEIETGVQKNSAKHNLGFVYLKKKLPPNLPTHPVEVRVGQGLVFPLSLVHGQEVNLSSRTRFSVDIRVVNSLAPIAWFHTVRQDYWEPLCATPVTENARRYYDNQPAK